METERPKPHSVYINPYTDFGFKKLFGEDCSKDLLIDFLNQLLPSKYQIVDLEFRNSEIPAEIATYRKAIYDIHCENERKDKFVVEMQKTRLEYFKDRVIWYMTFPIRDQAKKGTVLKIVKGEEKKVDWDFKLSPVYFVGILDFEYDQSYPNKEQNYIMEVEYKDQDNVIFYDKLKYFFIVMPRFTKTEGQLVTRKDKWLYFLKNLESFEHIPEILNEPIFRKAFDLAELAHYNAEQLHHYEQSYNEYLSFNSSLKYKFKEGKEEGLKEGKEEGLKEGLEKGIEKGKEEGILEGKYETARNAIQAGLSNEMIKTITHLTDEQIDRLRQE